MHDRLANAAETMTRMQRASGVGRITVGADGDRTRLRTLRQEGAAKIRLPRLPGRTDAEAVIINTAGGLTGGDRFAWQVEAGSGAALSITTQACEKIYRAGSGKARVSVRCTLGEGARLNWLPQETILFDGAALDRTIDVEMAADATLLMVEGLILGRREMGEILSRASFADHWRIRREGQLIHAEEMRLGPDARPQIDSRFLLDGRGALASVLLVSRHAEDRLAGARDLIGEAGGASAWNGKLLARLWAEDGFGLRKTLVRLVALLNAEAGLPKIWSL